MSSLAYLLDFTHLSILNAEVGEVSVLLQEDEVPSEAKLHGLGEQVGCEALRHLANWTGLGTREEIRAHLAEIP